MSNPLVSRERIEAEVRSALAATLRLNEDDIAMDASVVKSLQATSIDFLDVNFRLENAFGIQLASQLILDHVEEQLGDGVAIDRDNKITEPAAKLLRMYMGDLDALEAGLYADEIPALVTPKIVADGVANILDHLPQACTACNAQDTWKSEDGARVKCGACGADCVYPDGDVLIQQWIQKVESEQKLFAGA